MNKQSFMGYEFSPIKLEDSRTLAGHLHKYPQPLAGYTFAALVAWQPFFCYEWMFPEPETVLLSCIPDSDPRRHLMQPVGLLSPGMEQEILEKASGLPYPLKIVGVCDDFLKEHAGFCRSFSAREERAASNYIYRASNLARLPGRKYAKKRNLLSQAKNLYRWSCQKLTSQLTSSCFSVLESIFEEEHPVMKRITGRELSTLECMLRHFDEFRQQGVLITVDERPVAFSVYEAINPATVIVHYERALRRYKGLYQVINWETAKLVESQGYEFINREEDLGDSGLRRAKMSYHPAEIAPAYELVYKKAEAAC